MTDSFLFKGQRQRLVQELQTKGITHSGVLQAIGTVQRHMFFNDSILQSHAYDDKAFPIDAGQTISQPYTVAFQTQLLNIQSKDKVLEIGTGSGYQAAVLYALGARVYSIERQKQLYFKTKQLLKKMNIFVETFLGDGYKGLPQFAPFDKIIITAAAPFIPRPLLDQLTIGGIMVVPIGEGIQQKMLKIKKLSDNEFEQSEHGTFSFVPMLGGIAE
ncbi:MAG TPA: protein-L-isoaspartate(D-aspartate) O-methyltransferase [Bacteroidales bacterium]|nr:protein-L-isoaspartate(D-aspartate) O-methyltransferase [Bacteroidales bacterium]HRS18917.1 protein-L-isoaspartate(D-aspartate) O-methyltransferase [Bacteroidales bacterium]